MTRTLVIKIGGSLLSAPAAMSNVCRWLEQTRRDDERRLLIPGGGEAVDALRRIDRANPLSAAAAHWSAIAIMDAHALLLADWFPGGCVVDRVPEGPGDWVFRCAGWLRSQEPALPGERLTIGWETTSDAIAARMAASVGATAVFVKHSLARDYSTLDEASAAGVVDPETPRVSRGAAGFRFVGAVFPGLGGLGEPPL